MTGTARRRIAKAPEAGTDAARGVNTGLIRDAMRRHGPMSRVELSGRTGLSRSTVTEITGKLLRGGQLHLEETAAAPEKTGRGRPRVLLRINPQAAYAVGVRIAVTQITVSVTDFVCEVVGTTKIPFRSSRQPPAVVADVVEDAVRSAVSACGLTLQQIGAVCAGVPGIVDSESGVCHWSPAFSKVPVRFGDLLEKRLGIPTMIESHAVPLAAYERLFGKAQDIDSGVVITIGYGVGLGLILNGMVHRGAHGFASEFGHTKAVESGPLCECGQHGCLESFAGQRAILLAAASLPDKPFGDGTPPDDPVIREAQVEELAARARDGDAAIRNIFERAGHQIGRSLANVVSVIDPGRIIFVGPTMTSADLWFDIMRDALFSSLRPAQAERVELVRDQIVDDSWARGAAALVLHRLYRTEQSRGRRARR